MIILEPKQVIVLFIKFAKKEKFFERFYVGEANKYMNVFFKRCTEIKYPGDMLIECGNQLLDVTTMKYGLPEIDKLVLSQKWRFFILDNINTLSFENEDSKNQLYKLTKRAILNNGPRGSEELKKRIELLK